MLQLLHPKCWATRLGEINLCLSVGARLCGLMVCALLNTALEMAMAGKQSLFLQQFKNAYEERFGRLSLWTGGQASANTANLVSHVAGRRPIGPRATERFELGDLATKLGDYKIVIEFEDGALPLSNLLKYWPYIRGELSLKPDGPIILCHFSDWWSYATRRDLWEWTLSRMQADPERRVEIHGCQFDHWGRDVSWGGDISKRVKSIAGALEWIAAVVAEPALHPSTPLSCRRVSGLMDAPPIL